MWTASCPLVIVKRCSGPALDRLRTEAQMGENGGRTTGQLLSHGTCACLAWCLMSLAHIHRVGTAGPAVTDNRNSRCIKMLLLQGKQTTKGRHPFRIDTKPTKSEKSFADARRRPCRPAPTVPPRPVPWLPMAMADLTGAVGIANRRVRAQGSQPPPPVGDVGKCKQLRLLFARPQLFLAMPTLL